MFHHYSENSSSTGEPPTPPTDNLGNSMQSTQNFSSDNTSEAGPRQMSFSNSSRDSSRSLPDSGYEASPSSIADNIISYQFFSEQPLVVTNHIIQPHSSEQYLDEEFLNPHSSFPFSNSECDSCPNCNSLANCDCSRTDSSTTNVTTVISNCDNTTVSSSRSSIDSSNRPSSQPIQIPSYRACRFGTDFFVDARMNIRLQPARSQPLDFNRHHAFAILTSSYPLSWPSTVHPWRTQTATVALPVFISTSSTSWDISNTSPPRSNRHRFSSRRQIIDSEASSLCSSDEDEPLDEVFPNLVAEETSASFVLCPLMSSSDGGSPPPLESRRMRSVSVNLPLDQESLITVVGSRLRTFSDQFEMTMRSEESRTRRRRTIGSITQLNGIS